MKTGKTVQKGIIVLMMAVMLMIMIGRIDVSAAQNFLTPAQATGKFDFHIEPGEERHFLIPVKANQWINIKALSAETSNDGIKVTNVTVSDPLFETTDYLNGIDLNPGRIYNLEFDVQASDALKIGYNTISIYGTGEYYIDEFSSMNNELLMTLTSYTSRELKPVEIVIEKAEYDESLVYPDKKFTM